MKSIWCWLVNYGDTLFQVLLTIVSILIVLWLESHKRPKLTIKIGSVAELPQNDPLGRPQTKWTHVHIYNNPMPRYLSWVWDRNPALACRGYMIIHDNKGNILFNGEKMAMRWSNNPEPFLRDPNTGENKGIDWDKMGAGHIYDIPTSFSSYSEFGSLAVVNRIQGEGDCYGWNNDSYLYNWRNPKWKLGPGEYLAKIIIVTGGRLYSDTISICNSGSFEEFCIKESDIKL